MSTPEGGTYRAIPWSPYSPDDPRPLGRNVHHDPRSRAFAHVALAPGLRVAVQHLSAIGILDQLNQGSCVGHAGTKGLADHDCFGGLPGVVRTQLGHEFAVKLYDDCEKADGGAGLPTEDEGTSGTTCGNVLKKRGQVAGFTHIFDFEAFLDALQEQGVMVGIDWHEGGDDPDEHGIVDCLAGAIRGGHEVYADEFVPAGSPLGGGAMRLDGTLFGDGSIATEDLVGFTNSWSEGYGYRGRFYTRARQLKTLLSQDGDATILHPANGPTPEPQPDPGAASFPGASDLVDSHVRASAARAALTVPAWMERHFEHYFGIRP